MVLLTLQNELADKGQTVLIAPLFIVPTKHIKTLLQLLELQHPSVPDVVQLAEHEPTGAVAVVKSVFVLNIKQNMYIYYQNMSYNV